MTNTLDWKLRKIANCHVIFEFNICWGWNNIAVWHISIYCWQHFYNAVSLLIYIFLSLKPFVTCNFCRFCWNEVLDPIIERIWGEDECILVEICLWYFFIFRAYFVDWWWYNVQCQVVQSWRRFVSICGHFQYGGLTGESSHPEKRPRIYQSVPGHLSDSDGVHPRN